MRDVGYCFCNTIAKVIFRSPLYPSQDIFKCCDPNCRREFLRYEGTRYQNDKEKLMEK